MRERRRGVQVDLDVRREDECGADVVTGANELFEAPAKDRFCFGLVDKLELSRSHPASLVVSATKVIVEPQQPRAAPA